MSRSKKSQNQQRKDRLAVHLAAAEEDIRRGRVYGPFFTTDQMFTAAQSISAAESKRKRKKQPTFSSNHIGRLTRKLRSLGIKKWREQLELNQLEFSFIAGISINTLRKYERAGGWPLSIDATDKVCKGILKRRSKR